MNRRWAAAAVALVFASAGAAHAEKIRIEKADDLPPHTYQVEGKAIDYLDDDAKLMKLAAAVKADLLDDLEKFEIPDKTTLQGYYGNLGTISILEGRYDDYRAYREKSLELEDKEAQRLTSGLYTLSYLETLEAGAEDVDAEIARRLRERLAELPYEVVGDNLEQMKGSAEIFARPLLEGVLDSRIQPVIDQSGGKVSKDIAAALVRNGYAVRHYLPHKHVVVDEVSAYIDAHKVEKEDIWAERDLSLPPDQDYQPVLIAVWDSGVDTDIFGDLCWVNAEEVPDNDQDDDGNGYVDDIHGVAYTLDADKTEDLLFPIGEVDEDHARLARWNKGLSDLNANVDSEEASELKKLLGGMSREEVQPFLEGVTAYGGYSHGTHVAGIATEGNPYVRLLVARMTYSHKMIPEKPTIEKARKDSTMFRDVVRYFQDNGVRVVNMSWGGNVASTEAALEAHDAGGDPEERKKLARKIFEIEKSGLEIAIADAPEILFVTSAGNSNSDKEFDEFYPSSMVADNLMSVGAVDQAGDETSFTSFGRVDVYGNGFEVESYVPGGERQKMNGTSMSSPQVVNVAAKILAIRPELSPKEVRDLIVSTAEVRKAGDREFHLLNPKAAVAEVMGQS
jgi:hypothetical protein